MSIPGAASPLFLSAAAAPAGAFQIDRSLRFNSADSSYLNRTPSSAGNRKTWTYSTWIKRSNLTAGDYVHIFGHYVSDYTLLVFKTGDDRLQFWTNFGAAPVLETSAVLRDPSAWYHIVLAVDTTQSTVSDRAHIYINGVEAAYDVDNRSSQLTQNLDTYINNTNVHEIGGNPAATSSTPRYFNGYLAENYLIDGQQLAPTDFGEYDSDNNWNPKAYSGSYGTNGFHLDFSDNSSASALGTDAAGSNDWTVNNISVGGSGLTGYYYAEGYVVTTANDAGNFNTSSSTFASFADNNSWGIYRINGSTSVNVVFKGFSSTRGFGYAFSNDPTIRNASSVSWSSYDHGSAPGSTAVTATLSNSNGYEYLYVCGWLDGILLPPGFNTGGDAVYFGSCNDFGTTPSGQDSILSLEPDNDSLIDTPTNYTAASGNNGGNYCTLNSVETGDYSTLSNGNLDQTGGATDYSGKRGTFSMTTGKWYWEVTIRGTSGVAPGPGIQATNVPNYESPVSTRRTYYNSGQKFDGSLSSYGSSFTTGDIIGVAFNGEENVYSGALSVPEGGGINSSYPATNAFDGDTSTFALPVNTSTSLRWTYSSSFNLSGAVEIYVIGASMTVTFDDGRTSVTAAADSYTQISSAVDFTWFNVYQGAGLRGNLAAVRVGGVVLVDAPNLTFYKNGVSQGVAFSSLSDGPYSPLTADYNGSSTSHNFGQRPFAYTPPTGYLSLCTENLPDPTIADGSTAMDTSIWSGNSTQDRKISTAFSPDLVWVKRRNASKSHIWIDKIRGDDNYLHSDTTDVNQVQANLLGLVSDGYELGTVESVNLTGNTYVGWAWDGGSSTSSNSDGSITSSVRANASAGFSIVSYTGNSTSGATVGHGLNAKPEFIIIKNRDATTYAAVYHGYVDATAPEDYWLRLFAGTDGSRARTGPSSSAFNGTAPTNSVFSLGGFGFTNSSSNTYIAYCWTSVEAFSKFGGFTGNSNNDGPFVYTGFRPRWVLIKNATAAVNWYLWDTERSAYNTSNTILFPNLANAEESNAVYAIDVLSNGFKVRTNDFQSSGQTLVYAAFSEHPFKTARAR